MNAIDITQSIADQPTSDALAAEAATMAFHSASVRLAEFCVDKVRGQLQDDFVRARVLYHRFCGVMHTEGIVKNIATEANLDCVPTHTLISELNRRGIHVKEDARVAPYDPIAQISPKTVCGHGIDINERCTLCDTIKMWQHVPLDEPVSTNAVQISPYAVEGKTPTYEEATTAVPLENPQFVDFLKRKGL